ncbi:MAG: PLP-dependent aminotransferase family protein [Sphingopyxis sp.]|uniref:aminotransferase-like domain-containing protein n=1 Tax=Sphingopyxis sp. TaxID=1908224 RepID=UPI002ABC503F|nr:PLP-dependent aminotransferase family protein [Sphingopyxis sp.]MDZ3830356.1 PLP-dependent aminotransferase family protein [Sphingopyxis sp.]
MAEGWLPELPGAGGGAKYAAIAAAIAEAVASGRLRAGDRLPPQRALADRLGIDLSTVTKGYERARDAGLIGARGRAGSFVLPQAAIAAGPPPRDTGMNMPPEPEGGTLVAAWERTASALLRAEGASGRLHYAPAGGRAADRAGGAAIGARLGLTSTAEQMVVTAGAQNALHAIIAATLKPGETVACGAYCYPGFIALARRAGLCLAPLARIDAEALDALCRRAPVRALYVVPTNDNPTAATLDAGARAALAEVAARRGVMLIEDDAYGLLAERPLAAITAHVPALGYHIASTSKTLSPALRVAYVRAPSEAAALAVAAAMHESGAMAPPLNAALVTRWLEDGSHDRLIAETRAEARARQRIAAHLMPLGRYAAHPDGYHLWVPMPGVAEAAEAAAALRREGMTAMTADAFAAGAGDSGGAEDAGRAAALRVSLGGAIDRAGVARGLTRLARML